MTINWTLAARQDFRWLDGAVGSRRAALRLQRRIVDYVSLLGEHPYLGRVVPEHGIESLRELLVWRYRIW